MNPISESPSKIGAITVVGGGIAGIQAALDMADTGYKVYLVEEKPAIGGVMAQLDKTFPTNDCSACMLGPKLVELDNHANIEILAYTDVLNLEGTPGHFRLTLKRKARAVDPEKCVSCGLCADKCPTRVSNVFNAGLNQRKAIYLPYPQALPLTYTIDKEKCRFFTKGKCRICEKLCPNKAIAFDQKDETVYIEAGAVILAGGFEPFDARLKAEYGYGLWPDVITSLEYERILSASGPFQGHIRRMSDDRKPRRIAWIQCVGSRDQRGHAYCSSVCCMYAAKQAMITKEHHSDIETTIFYIDFRAHGKGFDRFYERSESENGVRYIRSMISRVVPNPEDDTLQISYNDPAHGLKEACFDMVVLSIGLSPNKAALKLAERIGIQLNPHGFCEVNLLNTVVTSRPGVFACGGMQGPKNIPDAVQQAGSAASQAMALLSDVRGSLTVTPTLPTERDIAGESPRIGVFVCHCGINIAGVVDVQAVSDYAATLPKVAYSTHCMFACSSDQQQEIRHAIEKHRLNRVVVASCTPRTHEPLFRDTIRQAGLNPYLFELANIREHDAWVHRNQPESATHKAKNLVAMSVARAILLEPLYAIDYETVQKALVIGGGLAGLTAAVAIAEQGFPVALIERSSELGGNARTLFFTEDGASPAHHVETLVQQVENQPLITVFTNAEIVSFMGSCGQFTTQITTAGESQTIAHGVTLLAIGGEEYKPAEYFYGRHPNVVTQREFESMLMHQPDDARRLKHVVMIQCVGSREPENLYCSRVCCTAALKNSLEIKALNPDVQVSVLYRDIRSHSFRETVYLKARKQGIRFFRFKQELKPEVTVNLADSETDSDQGRLGITLFDDQLQSHVQLEADLLVLSAAIRPVRTSEQLAETMRLPLDQDGFFMEVHPKLKPLDSPTAGVFLCGLAQGPKFAAETIIQARGAVSRALAVLSKNTMTADGMITHVDSHLCRGCGECEKTCLFEAIKVTEMENGRQAAVVTATVCTGCGACNSACPTGAASLAHFRDSQINGMIFRAA
ncbi:CoB--CoM heterodisulfide reductase iron-sulfur subunit A family protein [Desulfococcaceae bacterium HSG9]|nr:CoB--CoM heterodisulfide reductase iron-sulfur subunit A family protein [Desulfococcaceae bacterium HSG9]